jgi:hypothetical protein
MDDMKKWAKDNLDAPELLPRITDWDSELNYVSIPNYQMIGEKMEREDQEFVNLKL